MKSAPLGVFQNDESPYHQDTPSIEVEMFDHGAPGTSERDVEPP